MKVFRGFESHPYRHKIMHKQGQFYYNEVLNVAYINIPKCASTNIKQQFEFFEGSFEHLGKWTALHDTSLLNEHTELITVLRHPIERWHSGIYEYLTRTKKPLLQKNWYYEMLLDAKVFDEHTMPQEYFLQPFDRSKIEWFYIDKDFTKKWNAKMNSLGYTATILKPNHNNNWKDLPKHTDNYKWRRGLVKYCVKNNAWTKILEYYKKDVKLLKSFLDIDIKV